MKKISPMFFIILMLLSINLFATVSFNAHSSKVNFQTTNGTDNYLDAETINNHDFGTKSTASYFHFKAAESWIAKNNSSDVTGITFYYRIYKNGSTAPSFSSIALSWGEENNSGGTTYQRWGSYVFDVNILQNVNSQGTWYFECYWSASTNTVDCSNPTYNNNGGSNFIGSFSANDSFPVELSSFFASAKAKNVSLNWQTATEINNYGFDVERASSLTSPIQAWEKIGFVNGHGNSNSPKNYSFTDEDVLSGKYFYRLKQIDNDGKYEYSKEVEVNVETVPTEYGLFQNYPNPFNPSTTIKYTLSNKEFVQLKVFNILGNEITSLVNEVQEAGSYKVEFNLTNIKNPTSGIYFYRLEAGAFVESRKMTLLK